MSFGLTSIAFVLNFKSVVGDMRLEFSFIDSSKPYFKVREFKKCKEGTLEIGVVLNIGMLSQGNCWIVCYKYNSRLNLRSRICFLKRKYTVYLVKHQNDGISLGILELFQMLFNGSKVTLNIIKNLVSRR